MKINFESELMQNQTHAVVMAPDVAFEALQSREGNSLFFSIGTDHVFYLTREVTQTSTGWTKIDLSSGLSSQFNGAAVAAKAFSVAQNPRTQAIDLVLAVTVSGADYLFLSLGNANDDTSWANGVTWTAVPFDAGTPPSPLTISGVYIMRIPTSSGAAENIFVDILQTPGNSLNPIARYYITPGNSPQWNAHFLPAELSAGSITSCLGNRPTDPVPGIYTFGAIGTEQEIIFTPQYNYFRPAAPPNPTRLSLPTGAVSIASALNSAGVTNLFVSSAAGLSVFTPTNQGEQAEPVLVVSDPLTIGASQLAAATNGGQTAVWGVNSQGGLFYVQCLEGSEGTPSAWSNPVPLLPSVEDFAFFLNLNAGNSVLFANVDGQNLIQLTQDPTTANWLQRSILLPGTGPDDMAVYNSFTTHIQIGDDNGVPAPNAAVSITATSRVSVYLNSVYHVLSPTIPLNVNADMTGVITIVQETQSLAAVAFQVTLAGSTPVVANVNPISKALATLGTVTDGASLGNVTVTNSDGTTQPLVPPGVSSGDRNAAAQSLVQLTKVAANLPPDGSRQTAASSSATGSWGLSFNQAGMQFQQGPDTAARFGLRLAAPGAAAFPAAGGPIAVAAEDFFEWAKHVFEEIEHVVVQAVDGIYHFFATIAGKVYDVLLDCINSVVHAVEFVFNKIKVFFDDLIKWLGFIFNWRDIVNTHKVIKNVLKQCALHAVAQIAPLENSVKSAFDGIEDKINSWTGLPAVTDTIGSYQSKSSATPGTNSPQSNWAVHHTKANISRATTHYSTPNPDRGAFEQVFGDLVGMIDTEIGDFKTAIETLKTQVIDPIATLTPIQVIEKIVAILADLILSTAENLIVTGLEIIGIVVEGIIGLLDAPISIPILSPIYKEISGGDDLSFLDLTCLIGAIPATIIYKFVMNRAPYSDSDAQTLSAAADYAALQTLFGSSPHPRALAAADAQSGALASSSNSLLSTTALIFDFVAIFGTLIVIVTASIKRGVEEGATAPKPLRYLAACGYFPYVGPNLIGAFSSPGAWYTVMNDVVTVVAILKTLADNSDTLNEDTEGNGELNQTWRTYISPVAESVINFVWLAPAIGSIVADHGKASNWISFASNLAFDLGGIVTPASEQKIVQDERVALGFFVAIQVLSGIYGLLSAGTGLATAMQKPQQEATA